MIYHILRLNEEGPCVLLNTQGPWRVLVSGAVSKPACRSHLPWHTSRFMPRAQPWNKPSPGTSSRGLDQPHFPPNLRVPATSRIICVGENGEGRKRRGPEAVHAEKDLDKMPSSGGKAAPLIQRLG